MKLLVYSLLCSALFEFSVHAGFKHFIQDAHPFINGVMDVMGLGVQAGEKFMLIPSLGYESEVKPDKFEIIVWGWLYQPIESSEIFSFSFAQSQRFT
jgi:hypothetical protein